MTIKVMKLSHPGMVASFSVVADESVTVWRKKTERDSYVGSTVVPRHDGGVNLWMVSANSEKDAEYDEMIGVGNRWCFAPDWHAYVSSVGEEDRPVWERDPDSPSRMKIWER